MITQVSGRWITCVLLLLLTFAAGGSVAFAGDVVAEWKTVQAPATPELASVALPVAGTALLVLDIEEVTCNKERRPRCLDTVQPIADLAARARAAGVPVLYSLTMRGTPDTVLPPAKAQPGEPFVQSGVDKFRNTELENLLKERKVETVIVTGTAAHGAVLHTATGAALRGMKIVLPVDGLSAETLYIEQAAVTLLLDGPATKGKVTPTRTGMITFAK